ncbi:hypothetical protein D0463_07825 [Bacillus sp. V59.32b]|nr:hypothetical protein D0463_07825 [Bacillus sp. V59.32b]
MSWKQIILNKGSLYRVLNIIFVHSFETLVSNAFQQNAERKLPSHEKMGESSLSLSFHGWGAK